MGFYKIILPTGDMRDLEDYYGIHVMGITGFGMPPVRNMAQASDISDGSFHTLSLAQPRVLQLACTVQGTTLRRLHDARSKLISDINRDALADGPFILRYTGGSTPLEIEVRYEGGLELAGYGGVPFTETFALRLLANDPFWQSVSTHTIAIAANGDVTDANYIVMRATAGTWESLAGGLNGEVFAICPHPDGDRVFVGGAFTTAYNAPGGGAPVTVNHIAMWTRSTQTWSAMDQGVNGTVKAIAMSIIGVVWIGGAFTQDGAGNDLRRISWWDGVNWDEPGWTQGIENGEVWSICHSYIYPYLMQVGGTFTQVRDSGGGLLDYEYIVQHQAWVGWVNMGTCNGAVLALLHSDSHHGPGAPADDDGVTWAAGGFTTIFSTAAVNRVAQWYSGMVSPAMGAGMSADYVYALLLGPDGWLYAGGEFITADGGTCLRVARWTGSGWLPVGTGLGGPAFDALVQVQSLAMLSTREMWAAAPGVTTAGGMALVDRIARFTGGVWQSADLDFPGAAGPRAVAADKNDNLYVGYDTAGTAISSGVTVVYNGGKSKAYPIITITRTGGTGAVLFWLENRTTGERIAFDSMTIEDGETVTIDLTPGYKVVYGSVQISLIGKVISSSNLSTFGLLPGNNTIALFATELGGAVVTASMAFKYRYWSIDA